MQSLKEFASDKIITQLLIKQRVKCCRRNRDDQSHSLDLETDIHQLGLRRKLSRIMPPRYTWVNPHRRKKLANGQPDTRRNAEKAIRLTIRRDRKRASDEGAHFRYLEELDAYIAHIQNLISSDCLTFHSPQLIPIYKDDTVNADGRRCIICRPLSTYTRLEDKIILSLASKYLTKYFDYVLHDNILSYRAPRTFLGQAHYVSNFNDGARLIKLYRETHDDASIYAADCDIKKFYDIIPHNVVRGVFQEVLADSKLSDEGCRQVMNVLNAYLDSYNFERDVLDHARTNPGVFRKIRARFHDKDSVNEYRIDWVNAVLEKSPEERRLLGVPQGGALSLVIANVVLNDVDKAIVSSPDPDRLFVRYCDDMVLMHTDKQKCQQLMDSYVQSLTEHGLFYHDFELVGDSKAGASTSSHFWHIKSHCPFLWGDGEGNSNRYVGFLGYEISRGGKVRLRKSNIVRLSDKFDRLFYSLSRIRRNTPPERFLLMMGEIVSRTERSICVYEELPPEGFSRRPQYRQVRFHINRLFRKLSIAKKRPRRLRHRRM